MYQDTWALIRPSQRMRLFCYATYNREDSMKNHVTFPFKKKGREFDSLTTSGFSYLDNNNQSGNVEHPTLILVGTDDVFAVPANSVSLPNELVEMEVGNQG